MEESIFKYRRKPYIELGNIDASGNVMAMYENDTLQSLNVITVLIIVGDKQRIGLKTKYVLLATFVYRLLGVFVFLFFVLDQYSGKAVSIRKDINEPF